MVSEVPAYNSRRSSALPPSPGAMKTAQNKGMQVCANNEPLPHRRGQ